MEGMFRDCCGQVLRTLALGVLSHVLERLHSVRQGGDVQPPAVSPGILEQRCIASLSVNYLSKFLVHRAVRNNKKMVVGLHL